MITESYVSCYTTVNNAVAGTFQTHDGAFVFIICRKCGIGSNLRVCPICKAAKLPRG